MIENNLMRIKILIKVTISQFSKSGFRNQFIYWFLFKIVPVNVYNTTSSVISKYL